MKRRDPYEAERDTEDRAWLARRLHAHAERAEARGEIHAATRLHEAVLAILEAADGPPPTKEEPPPAPRRQSPGHPWYRRAVAAR